MTGHEYVRYIPSWRRDSESSSGSDAKLQVNPSSAIAASESRAKIQNILAAGTMIMVFALVYFGTKVYSRRPQPINVSASVNMAKSIQGTVGTVDYQKNSFSLFYESSVDPVVTATGFARWLVFLPPGERFTGQQALPLQTCYAVADIRQITTFAKPVTCASVVQPGRTVIVEYVTIDSNAASMVAKKIIGQTAENAVTPP